MLAARWRVAERATSGLLAINHLNPLQVAHVFLCGRVLMLQDRLLGFDGVDVREAPIARFILLDGLHDILDVLAEMDRRMGRRCLSCRH